MLFHSFSWAIIIVINICTSLCGCVTLSFDNIQSYICYAKSRIHMFKDRIQNDWNIKKYLLFWGFLHITYFGEFSETKISGGILILTMFSKRGFPGDSVVKNPPTIRETQVRSLGQEDPLEKEMATHFSIFTWEIPWTDRGAWQATVHEVTKQSDTT